MRNTRYQGLREALDELVGAIKDGWKRCDAGDGLAIRSSMIAATVKQAEQAIIAAQPGPRGEREARSGEMGYKGICNYCERAVFVKVGERWCSKGDKVWHLACSHAAPEGTEAAAQRAPEPRVNDSWKSPKGEVVCAARHSNTGANDPQDCDWPFCGCDVYADKVLATLQECGWGKLDERSGQLREARLRLEEARWWHMQRGNHGRNWCCERIEALERLAAAEPRGTTALTERKP